MSRATKVLLTDSTLRGNENGPPTFLTGDMPGIGIKPPSLARHTKMNMGLLTQVNHQYPDNLGQRVSLFVRQIRATPHRGRQVADFVKRTKDTLKLNTRK